MHICHLRFYNIAIWFTQVGGSNTCLCSFTLLQINFAFAMCSMDNMFDGDYELLQSQCQTYPTSYKTQAPII